jgi:hypothetical protein
MKTQRFMLIVMITFALVMTSALALNFTVSCPQDQVIVGSVYECSVAMAQVPEEGLNGLSFEVDYPVDTVQLSNVEFSNSVVDASVAPRYGFFAVNPLATPYSFVTLTFRALDADGAIIALKGVSATVGAAVLGSEDLNFNQERVVQVDEPVLPPQPGLCVSSRDCGAGEFCLAGGSCVAWNVNANCMDIIDDEYILLGTADEFCDCVSDTLADIAVSVEAAQASCMGELEPRDNQGGGALVDQEFLVDAGSDAKQALLRAILDEINNNDTVFAKISGIARVLREHMDALRE